MDPQQKLLLVAAKEALEDAGFSPDATPTFKRDSFGCFVGVATGDYERNLSRDIDIYYSTVRCSIVLNRGKLISQTLNPPFRVP